MSARTIRCDSADYRPGLRLISGRAPGHAFSAPPFQVSDSVMTEARDYSATLFLPQTDFPMRAGLPQKEPEILARWAKLGLYRPPARGRAGPAEIRPARRPALRQRQHPYRHRAQQDPEGRGDALASRCSATTRNYVPGWDCHGLPIEWKIEEEYRAKGKNKDAVPVNEFRARVPRLRASTGSTCSARSSSASASSGDWDHPYTTMSFAAEAQIARELMKFAANGTLYRGSKPVMWSRGGEDRARRGRGRVRGLHLAITVLGEVSGHGQWRPAIRATLDAAIAASRRRDLDDDAVDDPGQPRDRLFAEDRLRPLSRSPMRPPTTGRRRATL